MIVVAGPCTTASAHGVHEDAYSRGLTFLETRQWRPAIGAFIQSGKEGVSRDTVYYYMAEALIGEGSLDTALACNYVIDVAESSPLHLKALEQRYTIYTSLGITDEALKVFQQLPPHSRFRKPARKHRFSITVGGIGGYGGQSDWEQDIYPFNAGREPVSQSDRGGLGRLYAVSSFNYPVWGRVILEAGLKLKAVKQYDTFYDDVDVGGYIKESNILIKNISVEYSYLKDKVSEEYYSSLHSILCSWFLNYSGGLVYISTGADLSRSNISYNRYHDFWGLLYTGRSLRKGIELQVNLVSTYFSLAPYYSFYPYPLTILNVEDIDNTQTPYYTDDAYGEFINVPGYDPRISTDYPNFTEVFIPYSDTMNFSASLSREYININPSIGISINKFGLIWKSVISGQLDIYPEMYHWFSSNTLQSDILSSNYSQDGSLWLARNRGDGQLYSINELNYPGPVLSSTFSAVPITFEKNEVYRRDWGGGFLFLIQKNMPRWGELSLSVNVKRIWSTLGRQAPVDIPKWEIMASLGYRKVFKI